MKEEDIQEHMENFLTGLKGQKRICTGSKASSYTSEVAIRSIYQIFMMMMIVASIVLQGYRLANDWSPFTHI